MTARKSVTTHADGKRSVGTHNEDGSENPKSHQNRPDDWAGDKSNPVMFDTGNSSMKGGSKTLADAGAAGTANGAPANASVLGGAKSNPSSSGGVALARQQGGK